MAITLKQTFLSTLSLVLMAGGAPAQSVYQWDANSDKAGLGGNGVWSADSANWDKVGQGADDGSDPAVSHDFVAGDTAVFAGEAGTVSMGVNPLADIVVKTGGYRFVVGANAARSYQGALTIAPDGETSFASGNNSPRAFNGEVDLNGGTLHIVSGNRPTVFSGAVIGAGTILYECGGDLVLNDNSYTGYTRLLSRGIADVRHARAFGSSTVVFQGGGIDATVAGVTLVGNAMVWKDDLVFRGSQPLDLGNGTVTLDKSLKIETQAETLTVGGSMDDGGRGFGITKTGPGTLALCGPGDYTGPTKILGGTLRIAGPKSLYNGNTTLWNARQITVAAGGSLGLEVGGEGEFSSQEMNFLLDKLLGAGAFAPGSSIAFDTSDAKGGVFRISNAMADSRSVDDGALGLIKQGSGTLVLEGDSSYSGATRVAGGTLRIDGSLGETAVSVAPGAAIGGTGTVNGDLALDAAALLEVSDMDSPLTVKGAVSLSEGFSIANLVGIDWDALEIGRTYPLLNTGQPIDCSDLANASAARAAGVGSNGRFAYFDDKGYAVIVMDGPVNAPITMPEAEVLGPFEYAELPRKVYYKGEFSVNGVIDLIPEKSFFGRVFSFKNREVPEGSPSSRFLVKRATVVNEETAERMRARDEREDELKRSFAERGMQQSEIDRLFEPQEPSLPIARWHLYCERPGDITLSFFMQVTAEQAKVPWVVEMAQGDQVETVPMNHQKKSARELKLIESDASEPQPQTLTFKVEKPGRLTISFDQDKMPDASGDIAFIRLTGSAIESAYLLRARRRAGAMYYAFVPAEGCEDPRMGILETRPVKNSASFAPMKTPFGYTGYNFSGQFVRPGGLHWSMWGSAMTKDGEVDMTRAPRIIAQDNPVFSTQVSANEGTTVRGVWKIFDEPVPSLVQALRYRREPDGIASGFGYVFDQSRDEWRLYNAAQFRFGRASAQPGIIPVNDIRTFIETPGAYGRKMDGDVRHVLVRRAWFQCKDGTFAPAPYRRAETGGETPEEITLRDLSNNAAWPAEDYASEGWVRMHVGGMAYFSRQEQISDVPDLSGIRMPAYLEPDKAQELYQLPVEFGEIKTSRVGAAAATVEFEIKGCGPNPKATVFYGKTDGVTLKSDPQAVERFEALQKKLEEDPEHIDKGGRFHNVGTVYNALAIKAHGWIMHGETVPVEKGWNSYTIKGLEPGTKYYFRIQVVHDTGMSWTYTAGSFTTLER